MATNDSEVAVVGGTGALGSALAAQLARAGVAVRIGSRRPESAQEAVDRIRGLLEDPAAPLSAHENAAAVQGVEVVFLTVPFLAQIENLKAIAKDLSEGQILVDATVPLATGIGGKPTRTLGVWQGSAAQQAAEIVPDGVTVVSALHSVSAVTLADLAGAHEEDVLVMGDSKPAKARVARLIELIPGLRAVDGGALDAARLAEQLTSLLIGLNIRYKTHAGVHFTGLPARDWD